jgi:hypothetical protein
MHAAALLNLGIALGGLGLASEAEERITTAYGQFTIADIPAARVRCLMQLATLAASRDESSAARVCLVHARDVATVAGHYAKVEYWTIPLRVDGICLDLKRTGKRPTIIINRDQPWRRRRFTLAHELAYVLIPWHRGSLYVTDADSLTERWEMEGEANRFASELLMPTTWISAILQSAADFGTAVSLVQTQAAVSPIASAIRLTSVAPPNHLFAYCDEGGIVLNAGRSSGTVANSPPWNRELDPRYLNRNAADHGEVLGGSSRLYWWKLADTVA